MPTPGPVAAVSSSTEPSENVADEVSRKKHNHHKCELSQLNAYYIYYIFIKAHQCLFY